jgi:hypothetical protein
MHLDSCYWLAAAGSSVSENDFGVSYTLLNTSVTPLQLQRHLLQRSEVEYRESDFPHLDLF